MRPSVRRDKLLPVIFIMLQSVIYGFGNPLTKIAYYSITPLWCLTLRFSLAFVLFAAFFGKEAYLRLRGVRAADYLPAGISAALVFILNNIALNMTSATNVGFIMSLPVVIAPLMAVPILKRRYDIRHLPVQLGALGGIYLLYCRGGELRLNAGDLIVLLSTVYWAASLAYSERSLVNIDAASVTLVQITATALMSFVCAVIFERSASLSAVKPAAWMVVVYLAVTCSCLGFMLQNLALRRTSSAAVALLQTMQPIMTTAAAWMLLGERLDFVGMAGAAVIIICIVAEVYVSGKTASA
ncbi:MAG: DMT family transporter [Cloacibacillus porcorum]|nr:DMT family transporter [Cloacibacillus porcorum]